MGQTLKGALRPTDTVGRWGGDEFLAIVRNVNPDLLKVLAERCVTLTKKISVSVEEGRTFGLSISAGAVLCHAGDTPKELILRADDLLYRSKWGDRGRAMVE